MRHDETKLPKWAQKRLAEARDAATYVRFTSPRYMELRTREVVTFVITIRPYGAMLHNGDTLNIPRVQIDAAIAKALGFR